MKDLWDRIAASSPLDSTAAAVTSESADTPPERVYRSLHWKARPPTRRPRADELINPEFTDFTGRTFGKLKVLGIYSLSTSSRQPWVVRCVCNSYETRRAKAIRKADPHESCEDCKHLQRLRDLETKRARGLLPKISIEEAVSAIKRKRS